MRLRVYSDLHLEFRDFLPPSDDDVDVVVLAGDIHVKSRGIDWALARFHKPVVSVPGNHEYYGGAIPHLTDNLRPSTLKKDAAVSRRTRSAR